MVRTPPDLVVQIEFVEWTAENRLRHSRFSGSRSDKAAEGVRREKQNQEGGAGLSVASYLTRTTGIRERKITFRATEPNSKPATAPKPLLPMTISPHFLRRATATMTSAGLPICV